jgi:hypothetical protein
MPVWHYLFTYSGARAAGLSESKSVELAELVKDVDFEPASQEPGAAQMHAMCPPGVSAEACQWIFERYVRDQIATCTMPGLARAIHATQDRYAGGHRNWPTYRGLTYLPPSHPIHDAFPTEGEARGVPIVTRNVIDAFREKCSCHAKTPIP